MQMRKYFFEYVMNNLQNYFIQYVGDHSYVLKYSMIVKISRIHIFYILMF